MHSVTVSSLLYSLACAHVEAHAASRAGPDHMVLADSWVENLFDRAFMLPPPSGHAYLDNATLGKPGSLAIQPGNHAVQPLASPTSLVALRASPRSAGYGPRLQSRPRQAAMRVRAEAAPQVAKMTSAQGYTKLQEVLSEINELPPSERAEASMEATKTVKKVLNEMKAANYTKLWDSYANNLARYQTLPGNLRMMGIKNPTAIGTPTNTNDFNFLAGVVVGSSLLAVVWGNVLPGQIGYFGSYLIGGVSLVVLAIGSTAPGLLAVAIDQFARINPEYVDRIARHEAAHFLVGYAMGVPVAGYSLGIMVAHTDFLEAKLERKIFQGKLTEEEMLPLAVCSMAGVAAEGMQFEEVQGQEADLRDLQMLLNRVQPKLKDRDQQEITRWAVFKAAEILKSNKQAFDALTEALKKNAPVTDCLKAIETVPSQSR